METPSHWMSLGRHGSIDGRLKQCSWLLGATQQVANNGSLVTIPPSESWEFKTLIWSYVIFNFDYVPPRRFFGAWFCLAHLVASNLFIHKVSKGPVTATNASIPTHLKAVWKHITWQICKPQQLDMEGCVWLLQPSWPENAYFADPQNQSACTCMKILFGVAFWIPRYVTSTS